MPVRRYLLLTLGCLWAALVSATAAAADWNPHFAVVTGSTSNWYLTVYAEGPAGYNRNTDAASVINRLTVEVLQSADVGAKVVRSYRTRSGDWYGLHWTTGLDGQPDGTPMRLVAVTNDGKSARSLPFRFRLESPVLEGRIQPALPTIQSFGADRSDIQRGESVRLTAVFANGNGRVSPGDLSIVSGTPLLVTPDQTTTYSLIVSNGADTAVASATVGVSEPPAPPPSQGAGQWVSAYYASYQQDLYPPESIDWSGLTHIIVTRIKANADGSLNHDFDIGDDGALATRIVALAHQNGRKAILMLGGDDQGAAIRSAVTNHRGAFVANLIAAMNRYGFDGLDLDWENDIDWDLFVAFAQELRQQLPNAILTLPGAALNGNYETVDSRIVTLAQYLDQLNLMSYYPATAYAGAGWLSWHNSPLAGAKPATPVSIEDSFDRYERAGVPRAKLGMGIAFYAICYTGDVTGPDQDTGSGVAIEGGDNEYPLSELFGSRGAYAEAYRAWDADAQASYLSLPRAERHGCRYLSFEDEQSILAKGRFSRAGGYGGTIVWTINQGHVASHSQPDFLTQALRRGFLKPDAAPVVGLSISQGLVHLRPGDQIQLTALVTGTDDKAVGWTVPDADCGSIDAGGRYVAPAVEATCHVRAEHASGLTATAVVTVSLAVWDPGFHVSRLNTCWTEVRTDDLATAGLSFEAPDGGTQILWRHGTEYGSGRPVFATNYCFPAAGGSYRFSAVATDNRSAEAVLVVPALP